MNKTVTINISGIIFHIEEEAFEKLSKYLNTIRGYFKASEGRDEIMGDIEARIAEMLQEKVNKVKQVVIMADVDQVIEQMGKPEDFASDTEFSETSETSGTKEDPYTDLNQNKRRRIFRDPDDKIIGGVCSGIAAYFNIDAIWLRVALVISFFVFGFGFLLYLLLWIVIPQAKTTAEKLEMRGEKVNINNIRKTVDEEIENLKTKVNDWQTEASNIGAPAGKRIKNAGEQLGDFLYSLFAAAFKVAGKVVAGILIFIGVVFFIALLSSVFGATNTIHVNHNGHEFSYSLNELADYIFNNQTQSNWAMIGLMLFAGIPLLLLIYNGIKLLFKIKTKNRILSITSSVLWIMGIVILFYVGSDIANDFSQKSSNKEVVPIMQPTGGIMYLQVKNEDKYANEEEQAESRISIGRWNLLKIDDKKVNFGSPQLDIIASENDSFHVAIIKSAHGDSKKEASIRAKDINYEFTQTDSLIEFNSYYDIVKDDKWRKQDVKIVVKVPINKMVYLSKNMENIIYDIENVSDTWDMDMVKRRWIMTSEGLKCVDCEGLRKFDHHKHNFGHPGDVPEPPQPPAPQSIK